MNTPHVGAWRMWDGEAVVYDDLSGDTLKLDVIMSEIFSRLQQSAASQDELVQHLSKTLDLDIDLRLQRLAEIALERFEDSGLMVRTEAPEPQTAER